MIGIMMLGRALMAWLTVVPLAFAQVSCVECTAACIDSAGVSFEPPIREPGDYRIHVATSDGFDEICTFVISLSTVTDMDGCSGLHVIRDAGQFVEVAGVGVYDTTPLQIDVLVEKDGDVLADESLTPTYREWSECGDDCLSGSAQLALGGGA